MSTEYLINMRHVTKIFGPDFEAALNMLAAGHSKAQVHAETGQVVGLHDVSLKVREGEVHVVMGLSGSGKSTLIRHVNRLIDPTSGEIFVNGRDVLTMDDFELRAFRRTEVAMVFQKFGLLPHRSVIENVAFGLEVRGVERDERESEAQKWIEVVGLQGYEKSQPNQLSGGQQQRVGLARALAMNTPILLMDEAFSALDPLIRSGMQDELLNLQSDLQKTILFITHDFDEALKIGDAITVLYDGSVVQAGKPQNVVLQPANAHVEEFVRDVNKARAIQVRTVMTEGRPPTPSAVGVPAATRCEDVLPLFFEHEQIGVLGPEGEQIGYLTSRSIIKALARHQDTIDTIDLNSA